MSNVTPRYLGCEQKGRMSLLGLIFNSRSASFLLRRKIINTVFVVLMFSFQVWRYSPMVAMSWLAPLPLPAGLHQHAWLLDRQNMHTFWRRLLAGQRCRCWRCWKEGAPRQISVGSGSWGVVTCSSYRFRWWRWSCDCQSSPWLCGPCVYQAAIAAACRWGSGAIQCRRLLWVWQPQLRHSFIPKSYHPCPVSAGWPGLRPTSRVKSLSAPLGAIGRQSVRHERRMSLSKIIIRGNTTQIWDDGSMGPPVAFLA